MNALKTGIDAKTQLIRGETQTALSELTAEYHDQFHPTTPVERILVGTLIDCEWLLRRFPAIDTQLTENAWHVFDITLGKVFTDNCDVFARLQRRTIPPSATTTTPSANFAASNPPSPTANPSPQPHQSKRPIRKLASFRIQPRNPPPPPIGSKIRLLRHTAPPCPILEFPQVFALTRSSYVNV